MVKINVIRENNAVFFQQHSIVAVVAGGTSGIGAFTIQALAATHAKQSKGLRVYFTGRNAKQAALLQAEWQTLCPTALFIFLQAKDLALLQDVDRVCAEVIRLENAHTNQAEVPRIDLLFMGQAYLSWAGRQETAEGLDGPLSLLYYSRMRFLHQLLPLLKNSRLPSAHVVSVHAAGMEKNGKLFPSDLSLRDPEHYGFKNCRTHAVYMTTLFFESIAAQYAGKISLVHVFPGLVPTGGFDRPTNPAWFRFMWNYIALPLFGRFMTSPTVCGQRTLFLATERYPAKSSSSSSVHKNESNPTVTDIKVATGTDGHTGSGAYACNQHGDIVSTETAYAELRDGKFSSVVYEHTMNAFNAIEAGQKFVD